MTNRLAMEIQMRRPESKPSFIEEPPLAPTGATIDDRSRRPRLNTAPFGRVELRETATNPSARWIRHITFSAALIHRGVTEFGPPSPHAAAHLRNCRPRRVLSGHSAAEAYCHQTRTRFTRRERHATFQWLTAHSNATIQNTKTTDHRSAGAAWRLAAETWLRCQGMITITINNHVLPHFPLNPLS
jgi:hypothetical protein